jgi:SAM-dependent methyltransferase
MHEEFGNMSLGFWERGRAAVANGLGLDVTHPQSRYAGLLGEHLTPGCACLDIGCGDQILPSYAMQLAGQKELVNRARLYVGIDLGGAICRHLLLDARVIGSAEHLPFDGGCFDLVTANMVVEHLDNPEVVLGEIRRVLRPGGRFLFHTPNWWDPITMVGSLLPASRFKTRLIYFLEWREPEDVFPTFYRLNSLKRIKTLAEKGGFRVEHLAVYGPGKGTFRRLGPLSWVEMIALKLQAVLAGGRFNANILAVLQAESK